MWKSYLKIYGFNDFVSNRNVVLKQRFDRLSSGGDQVHATPTFEHAWATAGHTVIGSS